MIANPASGRGRGARLLPSILEGLRSRGVIDVRITAGRADERRLACEAAAEGVKTIIVLGGDGTWGNAANGILESGRDARLALLVAGTGNDFGHALGLPVHDQRRQLDIAVGDSSARVDVGAVNAWHFLNVAGFGVETEVLESVGKVPLMRGPLLYLATAVPKLLSYRALRAQVEDEQDEAFLAIVAANGPRFGGGFRIAPAASIADGLLDVVVVRDAPRIRRAALLARVRFGRHLGEPEVERRRIARLQLRFSEAPLIDVDGELVQVESPQVEIRCVPQALAVATDNRSIR